VPHRDRWMTEAAQRGPPAAFVHRTVPHRD
jgi:hypothetical protein